MEDSLNVFCGLATGALIKGIALSWVGGKKRKEYVGTVSRLLIYPLKSSREMEDVREAELTKHGLKVNGAVDRHWMVTKKDGSYYTLMNNTRLTLIRSRVKDGCLCLTASGCEPLQLPLDPAVEPDSIKTVVVKFAPILALDCGDRAAAWICKVLQKEELRLFYSAPSLDKRPSIEVAKDWPTPIKPNVKVAFQEWVPCMLMSESSVAALNKRLEKPVTCINFRPNVMVEGTHPFDEDNWREVFIGDKVHLRYVDHCVRGESFRPEFREIPYIRSIIDSPMLALTATATEKVEADIFRYLVLDERDTVIVTRIPDRPNIFLDIRPCSQDHKEELTWYLDYLKSSNEIRKTLIFCRCLITTIDPETGVKDKGQQPLKELKRFRCMDPYGPYKPALGIHTSVEQEGTLNIGDQVYVIRK